MHIIVLTSLPGTDTAKLPTIATAFAETVFMLESSAASTLSMAKSISISHLARKAVMLSHADRSVGSTVLLQTLGVRTIIFCTKSAILSQSIMPKNASSVYTSTIRTIPMNLCGRWHFFTSLSSSGCITAATIKAMKNGSRLDIMYLNSTTSTASMAVQYARFIRNLLRRSVFSN